MNAHEEMAAYDQLPAALRYRLSIGRRQMSAVQALSYFRAGHSVEKIISSINVAESALVARSDIERGI